MTAVTLTLTYLLTVKSNRNASTIDVRWAPIALFTKSTSRRVHDRLPIGTGLSPNGTDMQSGTNLERLSWPWVWGYTCSTHILFSIPHSLE